MSDESEARSPIGSVSIRSPMEKHMASPARSASSRRSNVEKISFASPASSKGGASRTTTPSKAGGQSVASTSSKKSKMSAQKLAAQRKRKMEELETKEAEQKALVDKLKADMKRSKSRLSKIEEEAAKVKFPVKDEVLMEMLSQAVPETKSKASSSGAPARVGLEPLKALPAAVLQLGSMLPDALNNEAVGVWDFLNVFSKPLGLTGVEWEDFVDLLNHTEQPSVALTDMFCALLRLALSDSAVLAKLSAVLPRKVNYAYRSQGEFELYPTGEVDFNIVDLLQQDDFDCEYNGLKLLPRKLRVETVDALRWQAVLRSVLLRLEPVKALRRAVLDVTSVAHHAYTVEDEEDVVDHEELDALVGLASAFKRQRTKTPGRKAAPSAPQTAVKAKTVAEDEDYFMEPHTTIKDKADLQPPQTAQKVISASALAAVSTPKASKTGKKQTAGLDKDAIYQLTCDVSAPLQTIYEAAAQLESREMHQLSAKHKLAVLKVLCDACLETTRLKQLLERNAEERYVQIQNMNRQLKEQKLKQREVSAAKKETAFQVCRKINLAAAKAEADRLAALEKKKAGSASKKKNKKPATPEPKAGKGSAQGKGKGSAAKGKSPTPKKATGKGKAGAGAKEAAVKGPGGGKDGLDPTPEQLNAMIEELVILEAAGVDVVEEISLDPLNEDEDDEGSGNESDNTEYDYDARGNVVPKAKRQRRVTAQMRAQAIDRKKQRAELRQRLQQVQLAETRLAAALETRSERELRASLKYAERAGCKAVNDEGKTFCTPLMKKVLMKVHELETQAKEDRQASQYERALQEYFVRTTPIGSDRHHNTYWSFVGDNRLFVQTRIPLSENELAAVPMPPRSGRDHDAILTRLYDSRPNRYRYRWSVYSSPTEQWLLWDALDERGERECALKAAIKARFDIEEPPVVYELTGSEFIGRKVRRVFGKRKPVIGLIIGWLPPTTTDEALWHVQHLDGDEEDLDEGEVLECLVPLDTPEEGAGGEGGAMEVVDLAQDEEEVAVKAEDAPKRSSRLGKSTSAAWLPRNASTTSIGAASAASSAKSGVKSGAAGAKDDSDSEAEFDTKIQPVARDTIPSIIRHASGLARGTPSWRAAPLTNAVGVQAVRVELNRVLGLMNEGLKRLGGGFPREGRKIWEHSVRDADTVADLRSPVMELEALVRDLQTAEDKRDAEEMRLAKEAERQEMMAEGWLFDAAANEFIGRTARRFFKGFGSSDGTIVAYLPPEKNDSVALYHMEHNDGDSEDLELHDLQKALRFFEQDLQEDEEEGDGDSDGEASDDEASSEGSDSEDEEEENHAATGSGQGATLWPTYEVRQRWLAALNNAQTVGEVGLALAAFLDQAQAFGVLARDPAVDDALMPRKARLALKPSAYKVDSYAADSPPDSPVRPSSGSRSSRHRVAKSKEPERARPSRAAARAVKSYAE